MRDLSEVVGGRWPGELVQAALREFQLDCGGDHGPAHWARVRKHGVLLALAHRVEPLVPSLFALFHDCCREDEHDDPEHGLRSARWVEQMARRGRLPGLARPELRDLVQACAEHSEGRTSGPLLVMICWDADRLDLGRVGIEPDPARLCTEAARAMRPHAHRWAEGRPYRTGAGGRPWSVPVGVNPRSEASPLPSRRRFGAGLTNDR